jgi:hypothetical protein
VAEMRSEMVAVRKEVVSEQSTSLASTDAELAGLRDTVHRLSDQVSNLERIIRAQLPRRTATDQGSPLPPQQLPLHAAQTRQPAQQQQQQKQQQPGRATTPLQSYEDLLLSKLSSDSPTALTTFVDEAPSHRVRAIFNGNQGKPVVSQPVILTLAHRLATLLENSVGQLGTAGRARLNWIWLALAAIDDRVGFLFFSFSPVASGREMANNMGDFSGRLDRTLSHSGSRRDQGQLEQRPRPSCTVERVFRRSHGRRGGPPCRKQDSGHLRNKTDPHSHLEKKNLFPAPVVL